MTQLLSKSINDNNMSPSADNEVIESFNLAISPWRSSMQVNTKKTSPLGQPGGAVYAIALNQRCRRSYNNSAWISDFNMHGEKRICQLVPSFHLSLTMVHVTLCAQSAQRNGKSKSSLYCSSVVVFLEYLMQTAEFSHVVDYKSPILSLLARNLFWKEMLFDRAAGGISRLQVDVLFHSLTVAGIIQLLTNNKRMQWSIKRVYAGSNDGLIEATIGVPFYKRDDVW